MPYTAHKPPLAEGADALLARIPGWGADLDPEHRPSVPRERYAPDETGAHWDMPDQQEEKWPRERSLEHARLTPVFGTACPPHGLSGAIRRFAYARFSEGRAAHWLLLLAADRVDVAGSTARSLLTTHPDNPITETGVLSEFRHHGLSSRMGRGRTDVRHQLADPVIVAGPWLVGPGLAGLALLDLARRAHRLRTERRRPRDRVHDRSRVRVARVRAGT